jgi:glycosyltransferase involved in cell wall biosynthesis
MLSNDEETKIWRKNLNKIAKIYTWENESKKLEEIFKTID